MDKAALKRFANSGDDGKRSDLPQKKKLGREERKALMKIKEGAKKAGSLLANGGEGGLPPSLVLGLMKKAGFRCKVCGELGTKENGGISLHHKFQHITAPKEKHKGMLALEQGRKNDPSQIVVLCIKDHDAIHEKDRAEHGGEDAGEAEKNGERADGSN